MTQLEPKPAWTRARKEPRVARPLDNRLGWGRDSQTTTDGKVKKIDAELACLSPCPPRAPGDEGEERSGALGKEADERR